MTTPIIDRKTFLSASVAAYATVALGGCSGESTTIRIGDTGGTNAGGTDSGGTDSGGVSGSGSSSYVCNAVTDNGDHSHPLTIPGSDVPRAYQDAPYVLEDGGTGHTHTLLLGPYDWIYLQAGTTVISPSSNEQGQGHAHDCVITCGLR